MLRKLRWALFVALLCWMAAIFLFSARTADESTMDSSKVGRLIGRILYPDFDRWDEEAQRDFVERASYPVRKMAHASEYAILGMLASLAALSWAESGVRPLTRLLAGRGIRLFALSWAFSVAYAATDELHQLFVPGRAGLWTDVMIDGIGALVGVAAIWLIRRILSGRRARDRG